MAEEREFRLNPLAYAGLGILANMRPQPYKQGFLATVGPGLAQGLQMYSQANAERLKQQLYQRQVQAQEAAQQEKAQERELRRRLVDGEIDPGTEEGRRTMLLLGQLNPTDIEYLRTGQTGTQRTPSAQWAFDRQTNRDVPVTAEQLLADPGRWARPRPQRAPGSGAAKEQKDKYNTAWAYETLTNLELQIAQGMPPTAKQLIQAQTAVSMLSKPKIYRDPSTGRITEVMGQDLSHYPGVLSAVQGDAVTIPAPPEAGVGAPSPAGPEALAPPTGRAPTGRGRVNVLSEGTPGGNAAPEEVAGLNHDLNAVIQTVREGKARGESVSGVGGYLDRGLGLAKRAAGMGGEQQGFAAERLNRLFDSLTFRVATLVYKQTGRGLSNKDFQAVKRILGDPASVMVDDALIINNVAEMIEYLESNVPGVDLSGVRLGN